MLKSLRLARGGVMRVGQRADRDASFWVSDRWRDLPATAMVSLVNDTSTPQTTSASGPAGSESWPPIGRGQPRYFAGVMKATMVPKPWKVPAGPVRVMSKVQVTRLP